jgi:hypothetical protein
VIDGGIGIEGSSKPIDAQHYHEKNGYHQGCFGDFRAARSGYDLF